MYMLDFNTNGTPVASQAPMVLTEEQHVLRAELVERVAKYVSMSVPTRQIALACGIAQDKIDAVAASKAVVDRAAIFAAEGLEQAALVNEGWDGVEEEALGTVLEVLRATPNPDFALRAAAVANRAQRRGSGNEPINGRTNVTATIELSATFIEKLQTMSIGMDAIKANAKRIDTLDVQATEHIFSDSGRLAARELFDGVTIDAVTEAFAEGEIADV